MKKTTLFFVTLFLISLRSSANKNADVDPGDISRPYTCYLYGSSIHHNVETGPVVPVCIYDDDPAYYSGGFATVEDPHSPSNFIPWNCKKKFLFTEYVGTPVRLFFTYGNLGVGTPVSHHDIVVKNAWTGAIVYSTFSPGQIPWPDANPFVLNVTEHGDYNVEYYRVKYDASGNKINVTQPDIIANVTFIDEAKELRIDAAPICANFSDDIYTFQIHSTPEFKETMFETDEYHIFDADAGC